MANVKITDLPQINFSSITNNDVIPIVDVNSNTTSKVLISDLKTFFSTPFTGGTVSGLTEFTNGLVSNTISATTYQNLPIDVFVTGGTYSNGVTTFTDNIGGTFSVSGYFTGYTNVVNTLTTSVGLSADTTNGDITIINTLPDQTVILNDGNNISVTGTYPNFTINVTGLTDNDRYVTGFSYNNNTFTIGDNSGNTYDATFNDVTGLTVNGTLSATTISGGTFYGDGSNIDNITASGITYDNISSELSATTVQEAIDEIVEGEDLYYKGNYVNFAETAGGIVTTSTYVPGFLFGFPIYIRGNVGVEELRIFITSGVIGNIVFGLYNSLEGRPNEKVFQTTEFNTSIIGVQTYTLPTVLKLKKGLYYVAYTSNSGPSTRIFTSTHGSAFVGEADASFAGATGLFSRVLTYNSTLPTLWGTPSTFNSTTAYPFSPYVQFKVAY